MKANRIQTTSQIEDTLNAYCRVCPNHGTNQNQLRVCAKCPINGELLEYGIELLGEPFVELKMKRWTAKEDAIITENYGKITAREIAELLGRTPNSAFSRIKTLRGQGKLTR